jgi:type III secretion protein J
MILSVRVIATKIFRLCLLSFCVIVLFGCGGRIELLAGISESEANEALAALIKADIQAGKIPGKDGLVSLDVDQKQVARAISILQVEGLPRERYAKMGEVFRKEGLISSPLEEKARYLWALSQELSATVSQIDGVIKARVHVVLPERSIGGEPALPSSAAVFIKYKQGYNLEDTIPQIKRLIANSISGLTADKVSVVLLPASLKTRDSISESNLNALIPNLADTVTAQSLLKNPKLIWSGLAIFITLIIGLCFLSWRKWGREINSPEAPMNDSR